MGTTKLIIFNICFLILLLSCHKNKVKSVENIAVPEYTYQKDVFPVPYIPINEKKILGIELNELDTQWESACVYSEKLMNEQQISLIRSLPRLQDDGEWCFSIQDDIDNDGFIESINCGAFVTKEKKAANFLLIIKFADEKNKVIFLKEFHGEPKMCCFYRISDNDEAFFGSGIIDSELGWKLCWSNGKIELIEMYTESEVYFR